MFTGIVEELGRVRAVVPNAGGARIEIDATAVLDGATESTIIDRVKNELKDRSLVCSLHRPRLASAFDRILVMEQGRLVQQGRLDELQKEGSPLEPLMAAE